MEEIMTEKEKEKLQGIVSDMRTVCNEIRKKIEILEERYLYSNLWIEIFKLSEENNMGYDNKIADMVKIDFDHRWDEEDQPKTIKDEIIKLEESKNNYCKLIDLIKEKYDFIY